MGKKINDDSGSFNPTAVIKVAGAMVKGTFQGVRLVDTKFGKKPVYTVKVLDADCKFTVGKDEAYPNEGDTIDIFAPTRLAKQLAKVQTGQVVTVKYLGLGKNQRGNPPHLFDVEVD